MFDVVYKPKQISDIIGNVKNIKDIVGWLKNFHTKKGNSCLLITGNNGVGKKCIITTILTEQAYEYEIINLNKDTKKIIQTIIEKRNILYLFKNNTKIALIITCLDGLNAVDKKYMLSLIKSNSEKYYCPIIFISDNKHNKLISDIRKNVLEAKILNPSFADMSTLLQKIVNAEGIVFENNFCCDLLIEHSQYDFRKLLLILQDLKGIFSNKKILFDSLDGYFNEIEKKTIDTDLFTNTRILLSRYNNIQECYKYYDSDKVVLPLMIYQNYINKIGKNYKVASQIMTSISYADMIENYMYSNQFWNMNDIHGFYACVFPVHILNSSTVQNDWFEIKYARDFNRISTKNINKKNIVSSNKFLKTMTTNDYVYISQLLRNLLSTGKIQNIHSLLSGYGIAVDDIEDLLKINRIDIDNTKNDKMSTKQKKELSAIL